MPRPTGKKSVPESLFIRTWQTSASVGEVASCLGVVPVSARIRAWKLRRRGVALKKFPNGGERRALAMTEGR
jgi:hypothetical protein